MKLLRLFVLLLVTCGFAGQSVFAEEVAPAPTKEIIELLPEDFKPAFTKETVIKLNAIVRRSFDAINEYDDNIGEVQSVVKSAKSDASEEAMEMAKKKLAEVDVLNKQSKSALKDMMAAATELRNSDEVFNAAILAGMIDFVEDVEKEISDQYAQLEKMLSAANS